MKRLPILLAALILAFSFGCGGEEPDSESASDTDSVSGPTEMTATNTANLKEALGPDGAWIILFEDHLTVGDPVEITGEVYEDEEAEEPRRKLALYAQDSDRNVTDRYTLTVPQLHVEHVNTRIQSGEVAGRVYVNAEGFELVGGATINGNLYFSSEELRESATIDDSSEVLGEIIIGTMADAVSGPTEFTATDASSLKEAVGPDGAWIILFEDDLEVDEEIMVYGATYEDGDADEPRRKLALYAQDSDRNVTDRYTLSVPRLVVHHMNTRIQSGIIDGDVYVEERGFELTGGGTIEGDLYFESEELRESATISDDSNVTGDIQIGSVD
ncbi:MAG: hypothetical protein R6V67_04915 [Spirochaetia bacterium]